LFTDKSLAIAILARDCEKALKHNIPKVEKLRIFFNYSVVIVIENDSKDQTKRILFDWERQASNVTVISENYNVKTMPDKTDKRSFPGASRYRIEKMCMYRNKYMQFLQESGYEYDYLIVMDIDIEDFDEESIIAAISNAPFDWGGIFANGRYYFNLLNKCFFTKYYDIYAFLPKTDEWGHSYNDLTYKEIVLNTDILSNKKLKHHEYYECRSAFGGIGIYKYQNVKDQKYRVYKNNRSKVFDVVCEHIYFNIHCLKYGKNYIASNMMVSYKKIRHIKNFIGLFLSAKNKIRIYEMLMRHNYQE
jgi:hypothetical protein